MLGRDAALAATNAGHVVSALDHNDLDVTDAEAVAARFDRDRPDVVINCAAWTDVDGAEEAEDQAMAVNGTGAGTVAAAAAAGGAKVLSVSTDYVFDGHKESPYVEVMLQLATDHGEVLVVRDQVGSPTYTWHLASGMVRLVEGTTYGIHHMAAAGACSWYDFAREIFDQAKVECNVLSATTDMLARPAPRPAYSALDTQREAPILLPSWRDGLAGYLAQRQTEREAA